MQATLEKKENVKSPFFLEDKFVPHNHTFCRVSVYVTDRIILTTLFSAYVLKKPDADPNRFFYLDLIDLSQTVRDTAYMCIKQNAENWGITIENLDQLTKGENE